MIRSIKKRSILIIDSIQTMYLPQLDSAPGTVSQVRASTHELILAAKKTNSEVYVATPDKKIIDELNDLNVNIKLITDGDILGALYVSDPKYNVDMFVGIGGGPEGVITAAALDTYECHFQGRFIFDNDKDILEAK